MALPPAPLQALYRSRRLVDRARMLQRWYGTPFAAVEAVVPREGVVVDAGCGFGLFAALLALGAPQRTVRGYDIDARKIRQAHVLFDAIPNVSFAEADLADAVLPAANVVVFYDVLHHLRDAAVERTLADAYDRLTPGGMLVVKENDTEPRLKRALSEGVEHLAVGAGITRSDPWRFRSQAEWVRTLERAGFRVARASSLASPGYGGLLPHSLFVAHR